MPAIGDRALDQLFRTARSDDGYTDEPVTDVELHAIWDPMNAKAWFDGDTEPREVSAMRDSTVQGAYFIMAARALGLDTGPISGFDQGRVDLASFADQPGMGSTFRSTLGHGDWASVHARSPRPDFATFNRVA